MYRYYNQFSYRVPVSGYHKIYTVLTTRSTLIIVVSLFSLSINSKYFQRKSYSISQIAYDIPRGWVVLLKLRSLISPLCVFDLA